MATIVLPTTATEIKAALRRRYRNYDSNREAWAFFDEMRTGTGYEPRAMQSIDAWVLGLWPSSGYPRIAYEIKVSRADFLHEIKKPLKRRMALLLSNQFYFAVPQGLVKIEEVPIECGLVEVADFGSGEFTTKELIIAPHRDTGPPPWSFFAAFARRIARTEVVPCSWFGGGERPLTPQQEGSGE